MQIPNNQRRTCVPQIAGSSVGCISRLSSSISDITCIHVRHISLLQGEQKRIEASGGCVLFIGGCHRVNGRLAVSRAIGDNGLKDMVIGEPDVVSIGLNGNEDFFLMACDGLWDFVEEDEVALMVYEMLVKNEGKFLRLHNECVVMYFIARHSMERNDDFYNGRNYLITFLRFISNIRRFLFASAAQAFARNENSLEMANIRASRIGIPNRHESEWYSNVRARLTPFCRS